MSGLQLRPTLLSFFTSFVTAIFAVFFCLPTIGWGQSASGGVSDQAYLIVPDMVLGNVEGTEEVFSSLYTELENQGVPAENISNFRYDPYDGIPLLLKSSQRSSTRLLKQQETRRLQFLDTEWVDLSYETILSQRATVTMSSQ